MQIFCLCILLAKLLQQLSTAPSRPSGVYTRRSDPSLILTPLRNKRLVSNTFSNFADLLHVCVSLCRCSSINILGMNIGIALVVTLFHYMSFVASMKSLPAFLLSTTLIPGLKVSLLHSEQLPFTRSEANILLSRSLEACVDDNYIFMRIPGLEVKDFHNFGHWSNLRTLFTRSSTILTMPNIIPEYDDTDGLLLDWEHLEEVLKLECGVEEYYFDGSDIETIPRLRHTQKRLISINYSDDLKHLQGEERDEFLKEIDTFILGLSRKLPSHKFGLVIGGGTPYDVDFDEISNPNDIIHYEDLPENPADIPFEVRSKVSHSPRLIFPDITVFDKTRYFEYERNEVGERNHLLRDLKDGEWAKDANKRIKNYDEKKIHDETWLEKKEKVVVKDAKYYRYGEQDPLFHSVFENKDFILENALWIAVSAIVFVSYVSLDVLKSVYRHIHSKLTKVKSKKD